MRDGWRLEVLRLEMTDRNSLSRGLARASLILRGQLPNQARLGLRDISACFQQHHIPCAQYKYTRVEMSGKPSKTCFVTIGATASFDRLIRAALSVDFAQALESHGYTDLLVQYGKDGDGLFDVCLRDVQSAGTSTLNITGFDLDMDGLGQYMKQAKGQGIKGANEGVVISHAGNDERPMTVVRECG